jgi:hypothetical protein
MHEPEGHDTSHAGIGSGKPQPEGHRGVSYHAGPAEQRKNADTDERKYADTCTDKPLATCAMRGSCIKGITRRC